MKWIPVAVALACLIPHTILIVRALISPPRSSTRAPLRPTTTRNLPSRRGGTYLALSDARRAGDFKQPHVRLCIGGRNGSSVRFLTFEPRMAR